MRSDELTTQLQTLADSLAATQTKLEGVPAAIAAQAEASAAALAALQAEIAAAATGDVSDATLVAVSRIQAANDALASIAASLAPAEEAAQ